MTSTFNLLKKDICKILMETKSLTELKDKIQEIAEDWDLEEEAK